MPPSHPRPEDIQVLAEALSATGEHTAAAGELLLDRAVRTVRAGGCAQVVVALGAVFVEMHAGLDEQAEDGYSLDALLAAGEAAEVPFSVAGGVSADSVEAVQGAGADVAVAGSAI